MAHADVPILSTSSPSLRELHEVMAESPPLPATHTNPCSSTWIPTSLRSALVLDGGTITAPGLDHVPFRVEYQHGGAPLVDSQSNWGGLPRPHDWSRVRLQGRRSGARSLHGPWSVDRSTSRRRTSDRVAGDLSDARSCWAMAWARMGRRRTAPRLVRRSGVPTRWRRHSWSWSAPSEDVGPSSSTAQDDPAMTTIDVAQAPDASPTVRSSLISSPLPSGVFEPGFSKSTGRYHHLPTDGDGRAAVIQPRLCICVARRAIFAHGRPRHMSRGPTTTRCSRLDLGIAFWPRLSIFSYVRTVPT